VKDNSTIFTVPDLCATIACDEYNLMNPETVLFLSSVADTAYDDRMAFFIEISSNFSEFIRLIENNWLSKETRAVYADQLVLDPNSQTYFFV
jgi:hypothetical protein